jgi:coproporphyrinogen III oxidase
MRTLAFDTLEFAKKLKAANFTQDQAEALAEAIAGIVEERLATKQDLKELEIRLEARLREMELRLRHDLTLRLGAMLTAAVAIVAALVKLL